MEQRARKTNQVDHRQHTHISHVCADVCVCAWLNFKGSDIKWWVKWGKSWISFREVSGVKTHHIINWKSILASTQSWWKLSVCVIWLWTDNLSACVSAVCFDLCLRLDLQVSIYVLLCVFVYTCALEMEMEKSRQSRKHPPWCPALCQVLFNVQHLSQT